MRKLLTPFLQWIEEDIILFQHRDPTDVQRGRQKPKNQQKNTQEKTAPENTHSKTQYDF